MDDKPIKNEKENEEYRYIKYNISQAFSYVIINEYIGSSTNVVIPSEIEGIKVSTIYDYAFAGKEMITSITIPDTVTIIGKYAFYNCKSLKKIVLSNQLTGISEGMMYGCTDLSTISFTSTIESIADKAFYNCVGLKGLVIPGNIKKIKSEAFSECSNIEYLIFEGSDIEIKEKAFKNCCGLSDMRIPFNFDNIHNEAFNGCTKLRNITLNLYGELCKDTKEKINVFAKYADNITEYITNGNFKNKYIFEIVNHSYISLNKYIGDEKEIVIPKYINGLPVKKIGYGLFDGANTSKIDSVVVSELIDDIPMKTFKGFASLKSVILKGNILHIRQETFMDCSSLSEVKFDSDLVGIQQSAFENCSSLKNINLPSTLTILGKNAFKNSGLTSIVIPKKVYSIAESCFEGCKELKKVKILFYLIYFGDNNIPIVPRPGDTIIPGYLEDRIEIEATLDEMISNEERERLHEIINDLMGKREGLITNLPGSGRDILNESFNKIDKIERVSTRKLIINNLNSLSKDVKYYEKLDFGILNNVGAINEFQNKYNMMVEQYEDFVKLEDTVEKAVKDERYNFETGELTLEEGKNHDIVQHEIFENSINVMNVQEGLIIQKRAFYGCSSLEGIAFRLGLYSINEEAFSECINLRYISLPYNKITIKSKAFYNCNNIECVRLPKEGSTSANDAFDDSIYTAIKFIGSEVKSINEKLFTTLYDMKNCQEKQKVYIAHKSCPYIECADIMKKFYVYSYDSAPDTAYNWYLLNDNMEYNINYIDMEVTLVKWFVTTYRKYKYTKASIPNYYDGYPVTTIADTTFAFNQDIEQIEIPVNVDTIGNMAIYGCNNLETIIFRHTDTAPFLCGEAIYHNKNAVVYLNNINVYNCMAMTNCETKVFVVNGEEVGKGYGIKYYYDIENKALSIGTIRSSMNGLLRKRLPVSINKLVNSGVMKNYTASKNTPWGVVIDRIQKLIIKKGVISVGAYAFSNASNLISVEMSDTVEIIFGYAFSECDKLKNLVMGNSVKKLYIGAYKNCKKLEQVNLPETLEFIGANAFYGTGIKNINIPRLVDNIGARAFMWCNNLTDVRIYSEKVVSFGTSLRATDEVFFNIGENAEIRTKYLEVDSLENNINKTTIVIPPKSGNCGEKGKENSVRWILDFDNTIKIYGKGRMCDYNNITQPWYEYAAGIQKIIIQEGVTYVGAYSFDSCNANTVEISSTVKEIGECAFAHCTNIITIEVPKNVDKICKKAFAWCINLKNVYIEYNGGANTQYENDIFIRAAYNSRIFMRKDDNRQKLVGTYSTDKTIIANILCEEIYYDGDKTVYATLYEGSGDEKDIEKSLLYVSGDEGASYVMKEESAIYNRKEDIVNVVVNKKVRFSE